jgi:PTS system nitrogen regulatory IIA component
MQIGDFLVPQNVMLDVRASDKAELLRQLCSKAAAQAKLDPETVSAAIEKREALGSTGVGNGVALPHARVPGLNAPFALFARLRNTIDFEAIDEEPVDIVLLLLLPETANGDQLNALACVARALRRPEALERIRAARDGKAAYQAITESSNTA